MRCTTMALLILILIGGTGLDYCVSDNTVAFAGHVADTGAVLTEGGKRAERVSGEILGQGSRLTGQDSSKASGSGPEVQKSSTGTGRMPLPAADHEYVAKKATGVSRHNRPADHILEVTAYTYTGNPTATGKWPRVGYVAVDPTVIPLGTRLYIEGYGYALAADTGGDIKGMKADVFLETERAARKWGRRHRVKVWILDDD